MRTVRVSDDVWNAALVRAQAEGRTMSDVIRVLLVRYGKGIGR
jgi:predicted CopG family antitoxin